MLRVRFAPSPTGYLHIGSARTFIFNWLYARRNHGTMVLRIDDTDVDRNTQASLDSIFDGLKWLNLDWDEQYAQSERGELHRKLAWAIFEKGLAYRDFVPAASVEEKEHSAGTGALIHSAWLFNPGMRELSPEESQRRADSGEPFVLRFRVPRDGSHTVEFQDAVYGEQSKLAADIEDFALLRSNGVPMYHMASCADDVDLRISHIIRGQDHLTNTFKHVLIFEALGAKPPDFAHLPLLIAPDGSKLSKRRHGPVVSVLTYRDAGFLPHAYINFLCLLGWSPKDNREQLTRQELIDAFSFDGIHRHNAVVNFTDEDPIDPKAMWLNAELIRTLPVEEFAAKMLPFACAAGLQADPAKMLRIAPLIPQKGDKALALTVLLQARDILAEAAFSHAGLEAALRSGAERLKIKAGQMFQPIRVAVCGRKNAPPLFETLEVLGRETCLKRIQQAIQMLQ
jgi:glutamyl-tRNA synthetase